MRADLTAIQVRAVLDHLRDALGEEPDEQLLLDTLEGETDAFELIAKLLNGIERDEGDVNALDNQIADRNERKQRAKHRIDGRREAIMALLECAGLDKLTLPEASLSLRILPAKLTVNDPQAVPDDYTVITRKPAMDAIKAAFSVNDFLPNWLRVEPERPSLTIRRK